MAELQLFQADDVTPVVDLPTDAEAGLDGAVLELHLWNHRDDPAGQTALNLLAAVRTESLTEPEVWIASGLPPQDELWWRLRIIGFDNRGDPSWSVPNSDWRPLGAYSALAIAKIPADCAVYLQAKLHPPSTADTASWRFRMVFFHSEFAQAIPHAVSLLRRGIVTGIGDAEYSGLVSGCELTVSATPDDQVHTTAGFWVHQGRLYGKVAEDHVLDLVDGDGTPLAAGESYWAAVTLGPGGVTVTRGSGDFAPQKPTSPPHEPFLRFVRVEHDPSGLPVLDAGDLDGETLYDRFHLEPGPGLGATLHTGQAIGGGTWRYRAISTPLAFTADTTSYVWLLATGKPVVTESPDPPETAALLLWEVDTDAAGIVAVRDRRIYLTASRMVTLAGDLLASPGEIDRLSVTDDRLFIERVVVDVPDLGAGTSGETILDVIRNGSTIYPSSAIDDQRPRFAFDASELVHQGGVPEALELRRGDEIVFSTVQHASGGAPSRAKLQVFCWTG